MLCNRRRLATLARKTMTKETTLVAAVLDTALQEAHVDVPETRLLTVTGRSPDMEGRRIIFEEDTDHPLIERPVLNEMGFVASQHLDSARDKFHLHYFSLIGEELLEIGKQPLGALSKLLLMPADIPEFIEDLPDVITLAKSTKIKRREQAKLYALDEDQSNVQRGEDDDEDHDVLQSNVKFASLKEQVLFCGDIPEDDPIDYHDVDLGQGSPEELADAIEGLLTSAEQAGMSRNGVQSLRQLVTECKDGFKLNLGADPPANEKPFSSSCATVQNPCGCQLASTLRRS
jgi:hypothetical protein